MEYTAITRISNESAKCPCHSEGYYSSELHWAKFAQEMIFPLRSASVKSHLHSWSQLWVPLYKGDPGILGVFGEEHQDDPGTGAPFLGGESRRAQTLQSGENLGVDFTNVNKYLKWGCKEDKGRIFQTVPTARMRSNRHKLEHRQFPLTMRKHFSAVRALEHWHRLWSPLQEIFRSQKKKKKKNHRPTSNSGSWVQKAGCCYLTHY